MLALALGRPLGIDDKDCDVELPVDVEDEHLPEYFAGAQRSSPSLMRGFIEQINLYGIAGKVLRQVYSLDKCKEVLELLDSLHGKRQEQTKKKLEEVQARQKELLNRTNRILRAMMKSASPDLSEHETKWFEELKRLQREIKGTSRYDDNSLTSRSSQVSEMIYFVF